MVLPNTLHSVSKRLGLLAGIALALSGSVVLGIVPPT
jgi:hypothetical protein